MMAFWVKPCMMERQGNFLFVIEGTDIVYPRMVRAPSRIGSKASVIPNEVEKAYVQYMVLDCN